MMPLTTWTIAEVAAGLLVFARLAGLCVAAPVLGDRATPLRLRLFMAAAITLAVAGRTGAGLWLPTTAWELAGGLIGELALGATIGYAMRLVMDGAELAAVHVGEQIGIGIADALNPTASQAAPTLRTLFRLTAVVIFLGVGGHRMLLGGVIDSFAAIPAGGEWLGAGVPAAAAGLVGVSFSLALKVAAPVLVAMLLTTVALGLLQRALPQCHILSMGMGVRVLVGLTVVAATIGVLTPLVDAAATTIMDGIGTMLHGGSA
jgi:flagellar biosynthetic protein FliR